MRHGLLNDWQLPRNEDLVLGSSDTKASLIVLFSYNSETRQQPEPSILSYRCLRSEFSSSVK
jgi:hypothetical protein